MDRSGISAATTEPFWKSREGPSSRLLQIEQEKTAFSVQQNFKLTPDEGVYGLGQHQSGYMNYRGRTVNLVQSNTEAVTPFLISTAGIWDLLGQLLQDRF